MTSDFLRGADSLNTQSFIRPTHLNTISDLYFTVLNTPYIFTEGLVSRQLDIHAKACLWVFSLCYKEIYFWMRSHEAGAFICLQ